MGGSLKRDEMRELEKLFKQADLTDVSFIVNYMFFITFISVTFMLIYSLLDTGQHTF